MCCAELRVNCCQFHRLKKASGPKKEREPNPADGEKNALTPISLEAKSTPA